MGRTRLLPEHRQVSMSVTQFCVLVHERQIGSETIKLGGARLRVLWSLAQLGSVETGAWMVLVVMLLVSS